MSNVIKFPNKMNKIKIPKIAFIDALKDDIARGIYPRKLNSSLQQLLMMSESDYN